MFKKQFFNQNGQVAIIVSVLIIALVGMAAYVVDTGSIYETRRDLQIVSDSAALAGAQKLPENTMAATQAATDYAALNNVTITSGDITMEVNATFLNNALIITKGEVI